MKKITGKVVSLVLALALVVTSFSSTFAFAATASGGKTTISFTKSADGGTTDTVVLYAGTTGTGVALPAPAIKYTAPDGTEYSGSPTSTWSMPTVAFATLTGSSVKPVAADKVGTTTATVKYSNVELTNGSDKVTVTATANVTVKVINTKYVIAPSDPAVGTEVPTTFELAVNANPTFKVYSLSADATGAVKYSALSFVSDAAPASPVSDDAGKAVVKSSDDTIVKIADAKTGIVTAQTADKVKIAPAQIKGYVAADVSGAIPTTPTVTATVRVVEQYDAAAGAKIGNGTTYGVGGKAFVLDVDGSTPTVAATKYDVTNYVINAAGAVELSGGPVKTIKGVAAAAKVTGGSVGTIDAASADVSAASVTSIKTSDTTTIGDKANVGAIDAAGVTVTGGKTGTITSSKDVNVTNATTGSIVAKTKNVVIDSSVTGNVTAAAVTVSATQTVSDKKISSSVGNIAATGDVTVGSAIDVANVSVGTVSAAAASTKITLNQGAGVSTTVGGVVGVAKASASDVLTTKLVVSGGSYAFGSLTNFAIINVDAGELTDNSAIAIDTLTVSGKFTAPSIEVTSLSGSGTITVPAGKLVAKSNVTGTPTLNATGTLTVGTVLFKSISGQASAFSTPGITLKEVDNKDNTYSYAVDKIEFAGIKLSKTTLKVAKGYKDTLTVSAIPDGQKLPAGYSVKWEAETGKNVKVTPSADGFTATVEATDWSDVNFNNSNVVTVKAYIVDKDGFQVWTYGDAVSCVVTVLEKPELTFKSDTNADFSIAAGNTYQFKITSLDGNVPTLVLGTSGVFTVAPVVKDGNDYFVKITATGKVGTATGIYVNGQKLLVASVKAPAFKSDTTVNVTVAAGKAYTYKITADATPSFGFGTGNVMSVSAIKKVGNDYFFTITPAANAKSAAATGVFVNGVKVNVATVK